MEKNTVLLVTAAVIGITAISIVIRKKNNTKSKIWTRKWLHRRESGKGILNLLNKELLVEDLKSYRNFLRMNNDQFEEILCLVKDDITKCDTVMRDSISARNRLEITLRFLATGETYRNLMYSSRIHESTISRIVPVVCDAIYRHMKDPYLKTPNSTVMWEKIADEFYNLWQFPHCLGALDGRHIVFRAPTSAGSYYFNYKGDHSIVLLGLADAQYKFIYVNVGANGRVSDGGVFHSSLLSRALDDDNILKFPSAPPLPHRNKDVPYVIIADDAFPLMKNLLKPFPQRNLSHDNRIFNYRLSTARRIVENSFGILVNRFRVLMNPINLAVDKVEKITLACVALHNYLVEKSGTLYSNVENMEMNLQTLGRQCGNQSKQEARNIREDFKDFFVSPYGAVPWQETAISNHNL